MYPTFRYHPVLAPDGQKFTDDAEFDALSEEWVDTPTKFPSSPGDGDAVGPATDGTLVLTKRRKAKEPA